MTSLQDVVDEQVSTGKVPGVVALVAGADGEPEVAVAGVRTVGGPPTTGDTLFRIASTTKPITAAATMALVERDVVGLDDPVRRWLPELASPVVLRDPAGALDDVVPADGPITVRHLLTSTAGYGFPADFEAPIVGRLFEDLRQGPPQPAAVPAPDEWMARLGRLPLQHHPGERFLYNASLDILGVLLARASGTTLDAVLADAILEPLGMTDTAFTAVDVDRLGSLYRRDEAGALEESDAPDGQWVTPPAFPSGAGGLVSTAGDWLAFGRMLLADGAAPDGATVLTPGSVRLMTTSHVEGEPDNPFLDGQGWGFGGGVDVRVTDPWTVPGRYGWVGGTGTAGYVIPSRGTVAVWMAQVEMGGPDDFSAIAAFLTWAAARVTLSPRLRAVVDALPLAPGMRVLEIGCGPGAAAREVAARVGPDGFVLATDRSERAVAQARAACAAEVDAGVVDVRCVAAEDLVLRDDEAPYDLAFAVRVGSFDGRHPEAGRAALARLSEVLVPGALLHVDGERTIEVATGSV